MIDTKTGKIWQSACGKSGPDNQCEFMVWEMMNVEGITITSKDLQKLLTQIAAEK